MEELHPIFTKDPDDWMQYVYKKVSILTDDDVQHVGLVFTVDPVSETFVLVNFDDSKTTVDLITSHCISAVRILSEDIETYKSQLDTLFRPKSEKELTFEEMKQRQNIVRMWLLKNRLPVEITGANEEFLTIADALVIQPPYGAGNCVSTNEIILGKIQGLIKNMPADQQEW